MLVRKLVLILIFLVLVSQNVEAKERGATGQINQNLYRVNPNYQACINVCADLFFPDKYFDLTCFNNCQRNRILEKAIEKGVLIQVITND